MGFLINRMLACLVCLACLAACSPAPAATTMPPPFAKGIRLQTGGAPFEVRGINYNHTSTADLARCPAIQFGADGNCPWDTATVASDMRHLHGLGVNTIRVFLNYYAFGGAKLVNPGYDMSVSLGHLDTLIAEASRNQIYVLPVLLAKYPQDQFGAEHYETALSLHVRPVVKHLAGRPGLLGWDLFNEPDLGGPVDPRCWDWDNADYAPCFTLAQERLNFVQVLSNEVRALDPGRLVTVSLGFAKNYFEPAEAPLRLADMVDFYAFHYYDNDPYDSGRYQAHWYYGQGFPADLRRGIVELHWLRQDKPVVITELGFPTGPGALRELPALQPDLALALRTSRENQAAGAVLWPFQNAYSDLPGSLFEDPTPTIGSLPARTLAPTLFWLPAGLRYFAP
jgi:endo-1,4-beta-mannosidase